MAIPKLRKYAWLLDTLYNHKRGCKLTELRDLWKRQFGDDEPCMMSERTFRRLKNEIEEIFGIDITCDASDEYRYKIPQHEINSNNLYKWMLSTFSVGNRIAESKNLRHRILMEDIPSGNTWLADIISAMAESIRIRISYQSFNSDTPNERIISPYCLKVNKRRWYLLADVSDSKNTTPVLRLYALDRMSSVEVTEEKFVISPKFDANDYFANTFGVAVESEDYDVETIQLKVYSFRNKNKYLRTLPLHETQREIETTDEYSIFEYRLRATYEFFHEVLSLGEEVEVLSPDWVRNDMKWYIENMLKMY